MENVYTTVDSVMLLLLNISKIFLPLHNFIAYGNEILPITALAIQFSCTRYTILFHFNKLHNIKEILFKDKL